MPPLGSSDPRLICRCLGISSLRIVETAQRQGLSELLEIQQELKAGTACQTCQPEIEEILAELKGEPVSKLERIQNRMLCREETERRIEGSLMGGIAPKLPPGTQLEMVSAQGLRVELRVTPTPAPELQQHISEKLRKFVCADLEIVFS